MKRKPPGKRRHVVAWINKAEWDQVLEYLYSKDHALQKYAVHRISAWKGRFGHSTPLAVEITAELVRGQILDNSGKLEADDLRLLYGTALVRFVNTMTERLQKRVAQPIRKLASKLRIPEWVVDLRHDITHRNLPSLTWCRKGCKMALEWLQQEYWSRQLNDNWDSQSDGEGEEEELQRQTQRVEDYKKVREHLIFFEREQFKTFDGLSEEDKQKTVWPSSTGDLSWEISWVLTELKFVTQRCREILLDVLMGDGFLIPTFEQMEILGIDPSDGDPTSPRLPRVLLRFWLPLLWMLDNRTVQPLLEKCFVELQQLSTEPNKHRAFYLSAWISEIILCNAKKTEYHTSQRKDRMKDRIFNNRIALNWQQLLSACLEAPCKASPHLLKQILEDMEHPLPLDNQQKLLRLCSIYTQGADSGCDPSLELGRRAPVYTLEILQEKLQRSRHPGRIGLPRERMEELQRPENADLLAEKARQLQGSPWQVCTDKVHWKNYPLGKVPGQSEDPSYLMVENYTTMTVFDQQVEPENTAYHNQLTGLSSGATANAPLWTHAELSQLKSGLRLF